MKRVLAILLSICLMIPFLEMTAQADEVILLKSDYVKILPEQCGEESELVYSYGWALMTGKTIVYHIDCTAPGKYHLLFEYFVQQNATVDVQFNGQAVGKQVLPNSNIDNPSKALVTATLATLEMKKGMNTIKLTGGGYGINFSHLALERVGASSAGFREKSGAYFNHYLPTDIEAEYFDYGKEGSYIHFTDREIKPNFRTDVAVPMLTKDVTAVQLSEKDFLAYTVWVDYDAIYAVYAAMDGMAKIRTYIDDVPVSVDEVFAGGYEDALVCAFSLRAGEHTLKFEIEEGAAAIDRWAVRTAKEERRQTAAGDTVYREFYVSPTGNDQNSGQQDAPFLTLSRAKEAVAEINAEMTGDVYVNLLPGVYDLNQPLQFGVSDSGKNGYTVVYRGIDGTPLISGGRKVTGWQKENEHLYKAAVPEIADMRTFYINGYPAVRARSKYLYAAEGYYKEEGSAYEHDGLVVRDPYFPDLEGEMGAALIWHKEWMNRQVAVEQVVKQQDGSTALKLKAPMWPLMHSTADMIHTGFYIENALALLDEPGEYYFDKAARVLYYYPYENETLDTADCYAGVSEGMLTLAGDSLDSRIGNLAFENLEFAYGTWLEPNETGFATTQACGCFELDEEGKQVGGYVPGQIDVSKAKNIAFRNCIFRNLGSNAINMADSVRNAKVEGCIFRDMSGSAVMVDNQNNCYTIPDGAEYCQNIKIKNNVIRRTGQDFTGTPAIMVAVAGHVEVSNNDMADLPYDGISCGYGWNNAHSNFGDNYILNNRIENVLTSQKDGAHIYCLGTQPGTVIRGNHLIKSGDSRGGIYLDDYSAYILAEENVIEQCSNWLYLWVPAIHDHVIRNNYADTANIVNKATNTTLSNNTTVSDGIWPEGARAIMQQAGVEAAYRENIASCESPAWRKSPTERIPKSRFVDAAMSERVFAADYLEGGEGVGYHDIDSKNDGGQYRDDGVDIWTSSTVPGRYDVGLSDDEWIKVSHRFQNGGEYFLRAWIQNNNDISQQPTLDVFIDDKLIFQGASLTPTQAAGVYTNSNLGFVQMEPGEHTIQIQNHTAFIGITYLEFLPAQNGQVILSENYDEGAIVIQKESPVFLDCQGHWAEAAIDSLREKGIVCGVSETIFSPEESVTLQQAVLFTLRAIGRADEAAPMQTAQTLGLLDPDAIDGDGQISREVFATLLMKAYLYQKGMLTVTYQKEPPADSDSISPQNEKYVMGAYTLGVLSGYEDGRLYPKQPVTRAQAAVMLERFCALR